MVWFPILRTFHRIILACLFGWCATPPAFSNNPGEIDCPDGVLRVLTDAATARVLGIFRLDNNEAAIFASDTTSNFLKVGKLNQDCTLDYSFAPDGLRADPVSIRSNVIVQGNGGFPPFFSVAGDGQAVRVTRFHAVYNAFAFEAAIEPDPAFGTGGVATLDIGVSGLNPTSAHVNADGSLLIQSTAGSGVATKTYFTKMQPNGTLDPAYGIEGVFTAGFQSAGYAGLGLFVDADGAFSAGTVRQTAANGLPFSRIGLWHVAPDGKSRGNGLGGDGLATLSLGGTDEFALFISRLADGNFVLGGNTDNSAALIWTNAAVTTFRDTVDRQALMTAMTRDFVLSEQSFFVATAASSPTAEQSPGLSRYNYSAAEQKLLEDLQWRRAISERVAGPVTSINPSDDGFVYAGGRTPAVLSFPNPASSQAKAALAGFDHWVTRIATRSIPGSVTEFYNSLLDHFFVTANPIEATAVDQGAAGPGWSRTGLTFKSGGSRRACRFYGVQAQGGPNGHFYTIDPYECGAVRFDPGWHFESYDFSASPTGAGGTCPAGQVPVHRAYNQRFAQHDSNHRLSTSMAAIDMVVAQGWAYEGVVMCVPA